MNKEIKPFLLSLLLLATSVPAFGQIIPPGLGKTNISGWLAVGVQQDLDTLKRWQSTTYVGVGRVSNPNNYNLFFKPGILVLNQGFRKKFQEDWEYVVAAGYSRQYLYEAAPPYGESNPALKQEFRLYGSLSYQINASFMTLTPTLRQEGLKYYTPDFKDYSENLRLRSRFRLKVDIPLTASKEHRLLLFSEQLFSFSRMSSPKEWTPFKYRDSRFSAYYSWSPGVLPLVWHIGYMNNLIGVESPTSTHYLAVDIIWKNPFSKV